MHQCGPAAASIALAGLMTTVAHSATAPEAQQGTVPFSLSSPQVQEQARRLAEQPPVPPAPGRRVVEDRSGRKQAGKASVYASTFQGKRMANGQRFDHGGHAAASKTLPLGTVAKVTNIENGRTAVVTVQDRGPYVNGRTVDLTKSTAEQIGIGSREGVAPVIVAPIAVPQADGTVKPGSGAVPGPASGSPGK